MYLDYDEAEKLIGIEILNPGGSLSPKGDYEDICTVPLVVESDHADIIFDEPPGKVVNYEDDIEMTFVESRLARLSVKKHGQIFNAPPGRPRARNLPE